MAQPQKKIIKVEQKKAQVDELREEIKGAGSIIFFAYQGLKVSDVTAMRDKLRKVGGRMAVVKNTLLRRATDGEGMAPVHEQLFGDTAIVISSKDDPITPVKELMVYAKQFEKLQVKAGILEGKAITKAEVIALSKLPTKDELIAKVLGSMNAPASNFVRALSGVARNLVYALEAIRKQKETAGA